MKSIFKILSLTALIASANTNAQGVDRETYCRAIGKMATQAMQYRQAGHALETVLQSAEKISNESMRGLYKKMAVAAYRQPAFATAQIQQRAVTDYAAEMTVLCLGSVKGGKS